MCSCLMKTVATLQKFQNRFLRLVHKPIDRISNFNLRVNSKLSPVAYRRFLPIYRIMFYLSFITPKSTSSNLSLRSSQLHCFALPFPKTTLFKKSISYCGLKAWNLLPNHIRMTRDYKMFKKKIKFYLRQHFLESRNLCYDPATDVTYL